MSTAGQYMYTDRVNRLEASLGRFVIPVARRGTARGNPPVWEGYNTGDESLIQGGPYSSDRTIVVVPNAQYLDLDGANIRIDSTDFSQVPVTGMEITLGPATEGVQDIGPAAAASNTVIDFSDPGNTRNKTGLSYSVGVSSQYVFEHGTTLGFSVNYGRTGGASNTEYNAGRAVNQSF